MSAEPKSLLAGTSPVLVACLSAPKELAIGDSICSYASAMQIELQLKHSACFITTVKVMRRYCQRDTYYNRILVFASDSFHFNEKLQCCKPQEEPRKSEAKLDGRLVTHLPPMDRRQIAPEV